MKSVSVTAKCIFILFLVQSILSVRSVSLDRDLSITAEQKLILDKFRRLMEDRLPHDYMKKEIYLIRWLRAKNYDIKAAEQMLLNNLEWRRTNKQDTILEEDFSDVEQDYKYYITTYEKDGQTGVLAYGDIGTWDVRKAAINGKVNRLLRYMDKHLEEVTTKVRTLQAEGHNVTQYDFVINLAGFNVLQHSCLTCVPALTKFLLSFENHFPGSTHKQYLINSTSAIESLLNAAKLVLSPERRESLQVYGTSKAQWQSKLFQDIPPEFLPVDIGGKLNLD